VAEVAAAAAAADRACAAVAGGRLYEVRATPGALGRLHLDLYPLAGERLSDCAATHWPALVGLFHPA
jgi:hypothetical protein